MSRFFKSAAFPILIVVVLAFFAQKLISPGQREKVPTFSDFQQQVQKGDVRSVTLNTKNNEIDVVTKGNRKYQTAYPDNTEQFLLNSLREESVPVDVKAKGGGGIVSALIYIVPVRAVPVLLAVHPQSDAGRWVEGHVLRQIARETDVRGRAEDHLPRRRRAWTRPSRSSTRSRSSWRTRRNSSRWVRAYPRACCCTARRAPARPCSPAPWPARRACPSSPSRARTSSRCSWASAPRACVTCSSRPSRTPPASSSWTRSTPSAATAAPAWAAVTTSASRR